MEQHIAIDIEQPQIQELESQISTIYNTVRNRVDEMYHRLETTPNMIMRVINIIIVSDISQERTEQIESSMVQEQDGIVRRVLYRMYITRDTASEHFRYDVLDTDTEVTFTRFVDIQVNSRNEIREVSAMFDQVRTVMHQLLNFYMNNQNAIYDTSYKIFLIEHNTINYQRAYNEFVQETRDRLDYQRYERRTQNRA